MNNKKNIVVFTEPKKALYKYYSFDRVMHLITPKLYLVEVIEECEHQYKIRLLDNLNCYKRGDTMYVNKSNIIFPIHNLNS